jgi:hypothetical protein
MPVILPVLIPKYSKCFYVNCIEAFNISSCTTE